MVEIDISEDALNKNYSEIEDFIEFVNGNISIEAYEKLNIVMNIANII